MKEEWKFAEEEVIQVLGLKTISTGSKGNCVIRGYIWVFESEVKK